MTFQDGDADHGISVGPHGEIMEWGRTKRTPVQAYYVDSVSVGILEDNSFCMAFAVECPEHGLEHVANIALPLQMLDSFILGLTKMQEFIASEATD